MDFDSTKTLSLEQPSAYASVSPASIDQSTCATKPGSIDTGSTNNDSIDISRDVPLSIFN